MASGNLESALVALNSRIARLQAKADALRSKEVAGVIARIRAAIRDYELSAEDLGLGVAGKIASKRRGRPSTKTTNGQSSSKRPIRAAKFADGQGRTWSGIGKRPNWFKEALAAGKNPDELLADPKR